MSPGPGRDRQRTFAGVLGLGAVASAAGVLPGWPSCPLTHRLQDEAPDILDAHGIPHPSMDEDAERRGDLLRLRRIDGKERPGGLMWQSVSLGTGITEVDSCAGKLSGCPGSSAEKRQRTSGCSD